MEKIISQTAPLKTSGSRRLNFDKLEAVACLLASTLLSIGLIGLVVKALN